MSIVLASTSSARMTLLANAGVSFESQGAPIDERVVEAPLIALGASPADIALALADAKALAVAKQHPGAWVIGADQVLDLDGERFIKPAGRVDAARQIGRLQGRSHHLRSAVSLVHGDEVVWSHIDSAMLTMRALDEAEIERYLDRAGDDILWSVGAYMLEGIGIQLFSAIEGDYFSILGLPLLPLLGALREEGALSL